MGIHAPQVYLDSPEPASVAAINDFSTRALADQVPLLSPLLLTSSVSASRKVSPIVISPPQSVSQSVSEEAKEGDFAFLQLFNIYDRSKK